MFSSKSRNAHRSGRVSGSRTWCGVDTSEEQEESGMAGIYFVIRSSILRGSRIKVGKTTLLRSAPGRRWEMMWESTECSSDVVSMRTPTISHLRACRKGPGWHKEGGIKRPYHCPGQHRLPEYCHQWRGRRRFGRLPKFWNLAQEPGRTTTMLAWLPVSSEFVFVSFWGFPLWVGSVGGANAQKRIAGWGEGDGQDGGR